MKGKISPQMTFLDAADQVLKKSKTPMTARQITEEAVRLGMIDSQGKTPANTMGAKLRSNEKIGNTRFIRVEEPGSRKWNVKWTLGSASDG